MQLNYGLWLNILQDVFFFLKELLESYSSMSNQPVYIVTAALSLSLSLSVSLSLSLSLSLFSLFFVHVCQIPNGGPVIVFPTHRSPVEEPHCDCHVKVTDNTTRKAKIRLITACLIVFVFMIGEVIGELLLYNYNHHSTKLYQKISRVCCRLYCYECAARVTMPTATNE